MCVEGIKQVEPQSVCIHTTIQSQFALTSDIWHLHAYSSSHSQYGTILVCIDADNDNTNRLYLNKGKWNIELKRGESVSWVSYHNDQLLEEVCTNTHTHTNTLRDIYMHVV